MTQTLLVGNTRGDNVLQYNAATGEFINQFIAPRTGGLSDPDTLLYGPDVNQDGFNDLYIASGAEFGNSGGLGAASVLVYDGLSGAFIKALVQDNPATTADETGELIRPYGIAFAPDGTLYVSSFRSDKILRYNGTTGAFIDVFASGNGTANGLNGPNGLLFIGNSLYVTTQGSVADAAGNISFLFDSQILRYDSLAAGSTPIVFAPQPTPDPASFGFVSFLGLALGRNGDLYASDFANGVRRYNLTTGALVESLSTNYTGTTPSSNFIGSLAFGATGDLYVVGFDVNTEIGAVIRYDGSSGTPVSPFTTLVVPNSRQRSIGLTFGPNPDTLLVGNTRGDNVYQFNAQTGAFIKEFIAPRTGGLSDPDTLLYGPDANGDGQADLYVASGNKPSTSTEVGASSVLVYDGQSGAFIKALVRDNPATTVDETGGLFRPYGMAFGPDGNLYVSSFRSDKILRYNATTGAFVDVFASGTGTANGLNGPNGLLFIGNSLYVTTQGSVADADGNVSFVFDSQVLRYDSLAAGSTPIVFAPQPTPDPASFGFVSFLGLALAPNGDLYVSDFANSIRRYNLTTGTLVETLSTNYTGTTPSSNFIGNLAFSTTGDLYVAGFDVNTEIGAVIRYDGSSGTPVSPFTTLVVPNSRQRSIGIVLPPSVNISGTNPAEAGTTNGNFRLKLREAAPAGGLTVGYKLGGTATGTTDYQLVAGRNITALTATSFTIAAGATEAILEVVPVDDTIADLGETVQLTLLEGNGYTIPGASTTTLTILDNDGLSFTASSDNLFSVGGSPNQTQMNLLVNLVNFDASAVNEVGYFAVSDDQGTVNGLQPGQAGYLQAALAQSTIVFSTLSNPPNGFNRNLSSVVSATGGSRLVFYLVANSTTDAFLAGNISEFAIILGSTFGSNSFRQLQVSQTGGIFTLNWEDQPGGGDRSFGDLILTVQPTTRSIPTGAALQSRLQGEVLNLQGISGNVTARFTVTREAAFNNTVGFYQVTGLTGGIDINGDGIADVLPGDANYTRTAIQQRLTNINLNTSNQTTSTFTNQFTGGSIFAPFIIANGTFDLLLDNDTSNDPAVYFPFLAANPGRVDHVRLLGNNTFGFEDLPNGGDRDYNDIVVQVSFS
jgi:hypothetical protein